jgi:hypothetical protein
VSSPVIRVVDILRCHLPFHRLARYTIIGEGLDQLSSNLQLLSIILFFCCQDHIQNLVESTCCLIYLVLSEFHAVVELWVLLLNLDLLQIMQSFHLLGVQTSLDRVGFLLAQIRIYRGIHTILWRLENRRFAVLFILRQHVLRIRSFFLLQVALRTAHILTSLDIKCVCHVRYLILSVEGADGVGDLGV